MILGITSDSPVGSRHARFAATAEKFVSEQLEPRCYFAVSFGTPETLPVSASGNNTISADLNGDGKPDVVTDDPNGNNVTVFINQGSGKFAAGVAYAVGSSPDWIVAQDFNGDGKIDLAVANEKDASVSILSNNGNGTFAPKRDISVGTSTTSTFAATLCIAAGDFTGDGKLDLLVSDSFDNKLVLLPGDGAGNFGTALSTPLDNASLMASGDFNGDGKADIAVSASGASLSGGFVSVLLSNGNNTFQPVANYAVDALPEPLAYADFTGDGKPDLAVFTVSNTLSVLPGNGDGTFQPTVNVPLSRHFGSSFQSATADFDGDGRPDVATTVLSELDVYFNGHDAPTGSGGGGGGGGGGSATLTPTLSAKLPASVLGGAKATGFKGTLTLANPGAATVTGTATVNLYLSTDRAFDTSDVLVTAKPMSVKLNLKKFGHQAVALALKTFPNVSGDFFLLARVTGAALSPVVATSVGSVHIAPAFVDLAASALTVKPTTVKRGKKLTLTLAVSNLGNVAVTGKKLAANLALSMSPDGSSPSLIGVASSSLSVKAQGHQSLRFTITAPASLLPGTYFPVLTIDPANVFSETTLANNTAVSSGSLTVA